MILEVSIIATCWGCSEGMFKWDNFSPHVDKGHELEKQLEKSSMTKNICTSPAPKLAFGGQSHSEETSTSYSCNGI